jgi:hypothetical protein
MEFPSLFCLLPSISDSHSSCAARGNINDIYSKALLLLME